MKDLKVGDILYTDINDRILPRYITVIFVSGELVVCKTRYQKALPNMTITQLIDNGYQIINREDADR